MFPYYIWLSMINLVGGEFFVSSIDKKGCAYTENCLNDPWVWALRQVHQPFIVGLLIQPI